MDGINLGELKHSQPARSYVAMLGYMTLCVYCSMLVCLQTNYCLIYRLISLFLEDAEEFGLSVRNYDKRHEELCKLAVSIWFNML